MCIGGYKMRFSVKLVMLIKSSEQWLYFKILWMHLASTESPFEYPFSNGCFYSFHIKHSNVWIIVSFVSMETKKYQ